MILAGVITAAGCDAAPVNNDTSDEQVQAKPAIERIERGNLVVEGVPDIPTEVAEQLHRYQNVRAHGFSDWTDEGILIRTRFAETAQVHHVATPLGARRQTTFYDEPVSGINASPQRDRFLFTKDTGGDEFFQGFLSDTKTGAVGAFTEAGTRNGSFVWRDDGQLVAWYRATDGDPDYDILIGDPSDPSTIQIAHAGEGAMFPVDFSADGETLALQRFISITKSEIFTLDLETGALNELNPGQEIAYAGLYLLSDGSILTSTDKDSEFKNLLRINPQTGEVQNFTNAINWGVSSYVLSPDEKTVVFTINESGLGTIKILDLETGDIRNGPELPVGIAHGLVFNTDGSEIGFSFTGATSPTDAYSFNLVTLEVTRWTQAEIGGLESARFVEPELFTYPSTNDMDIPAFVYRPNGIGPHPVIISIHGGPEAQSRPSFSSTFQYWVNELGAAVVVPNVRGSAGYGKTYVSLDNGLNRKRSVEDIGALLDWIETQEELDKNRVVVYGGSYGGYMVLASLIDYGERLAGGVNIVGISDFRTFLENTKGYRRDLRRVEYGDERDPEIAAFFEEISPLRNASQINKPLFIIQGLNDPRVPASEAEQILAAVRANGGQAWYLLAKDEGHGFKKKSNRDFQCEAEALFLRSVLSRD